ncbi:MAG: hypothetical protein ACI4W0_02980 [Bacilli bacterium]
MAKRNNLILSIFLMTISIFLLLGINKTIKDHHDRQYTVVYNKIKEAAKACYQKAECEGEITLKDLYDKGYLDEAIDPITKEPIDSSLCLTKEEKNIMFCKEKGE